MTTVEHDDGTAVVRLAHGKANALDLEFCAAVTRQFEALAREDARAVVVTADGGIFSAGVDLKRLLEGGAAYMRAFLPALHDMCVALFAFPKPLVAAVNGHAIAGGCIIACTADRRLLARGGARIGVPELAVGVPFPPAPLEILRYVVPPPALHEVVCAAGTYAGDEALARGLVDECVEGERLLPRALEWAGTLAGYGEAFRLTKRQLRAPALERMRMGATSYAAEAERVWSAPETFAAVSAYVERTLRKSGR